MKFEIDFSVVWTQPNYYIMAPKVANIIFLHVFDELFHEGIETPFGVNRNWNIEIKKYLWTFVTFSKHERTSCTCYSWQVLDNCVKLHFCAVRHATEKSRIVVGRIALQDRQRNVVPWKCQTWKWLHGTKIMASAPENDECSYGQCLSRKVQKRWQFGWVISNELKMNDFRGVNECMMYD